MVKSKQHFLKVNMFVYSVIFNHVFCLHFQNYERMNIADALFSRTYEDGDVIIKQVNTDLHEQT